MNAGIFSDLAGQRFGAIAADPPWAFKVFAPPKEGQQNHNVERHYDTMALADIMAMPVRDIAAKDCHLFLWTTTPHLPSALKVIEAWGFKYSASAFVWIKQRRGFKANQLRFIPNAEADLHVGMGFTTRKNAEICLLARRGSPKRLSRSVREVIISPVREHSRKPDESYQRIEQYCAGPYLELFSRVDRQNWTTWGHQKGLLNPAPAGPVGNLTQGER